MHVTLVPDWFDPAETPGIITPYMVLYALHDAIVKPMPGKPRRRAGRILDGLADGLVYEFVLRKGVRFHNGDPVTADDVKFSFERYRGAAQDAQGRVAAVETPIAGRVRFRLKQPWPDFMTFYTSATGAGWIVPKKYVEKVGDEGFKKAPIGAGPYKFVSFTPGVELVMEAFDSTGARRPSVKRLVFRVIPDEATRLAALKRGEVDIVYSIRGELAEELQRTPGLTLKPAVIQGTFWLYFADQWDPKSPWHDRRVRLAASHAIDRETINQAVTLGFSKSRQHHSDDRSSTTGSPRLRVRSGQGEAAPGRGRLSQRLRRGRVLLRLSYANLGEAVVNYLQAVGIRVKLRPAGARRVLQGLRREEAQEPHPGRQRRLRQCGHAAGGVRRHGRRFAYGGYPGRRAVPGAGHRAGQRSAARRRCTDPAARAREGDVRADLAAGVPERRRARRGESGSGPDPGYAYSAPYEDLTLKGK